MEIRSLGCMLHIQIFWVYLVRSISLLCAGVGRVHDAENNFVRPLSVSQFHQRRR